MSTGPAASPGATAISISRLTWGNVRSADGVVRVLENWNGPKIQELRRKHAKGETDSVSPCNT
jgi:hypothetical protein